MFAIQNIFVVSILFFAPSVYAQSSFQNVHLWQSGGLSQARTCWVLPRDFDSSEVSEAWFDGFEVGDMPPVDVGAQMVELSGSEWQLARSQERQLFAYCSFSSRHLLIEVQPEDDGVEPLFVGVKENELESLEVFIENIEEQMEDIANNKPDDIAGVPVVDGSLDYVVCTTSSRLNVRDESLNNVLFQADRFESLLKVQSFGTDKKTLSVGSKTYEFIQAQFPERNNRRGWVAQDFVKTRDQCPGLNEPTPPLISDGWRFPTIKRPSVTYRTGVPSFGARRNGGARSHAACDLYRVANEEVVAANSGKVIRDLYLFYQGTYAIEVRHSDGRVVRYAEISGKRAPGMGLNKNLEGGQVLGYIGILNSGCCTPMLHFEMYSGQGQGPLTQSGNKFNRRWDLQDPTDDLLNWELSTFGVSY